MIIESWMISTAIAIAGGIATHATTRSKLGILKEDFKEHLQEDNVYHRDMDRKLDAQFKRVDSLTNRCTILEQADKSHLDIDTAEAKFVSKKELELHLKNIELVSQNTQKTVEKIEGKLEDIVEVLTDIKQQRSIKCGER